jgi:hypothetical protein
MPIAHQTYNFFGSVLACSTPVKAMTTKNNRRAMICILDLRQNERNAKSVGKEVNMCVSSKTFTEATSCSS